MITLLFDIDGTLVNTGGAGGAALRSAFRDLFRVPRPRDVEYSGRTDRAIALSMLEVNSVDQSEDNWRRLRDEYLQQLPGFLPRCRGEVLPGIVHLLERLAAVEHVKLGLLTGNLREGARMKLEHFGLMKYFDFGGFGDEHLDRNHVAEEAVVNARSRLTERWNPDRVWVIGDTPLDIRCARWINARVLAVATGNHPRDELAGCSPDRLADDLSETDRIVDWLT